MRDANWFVDFPTSARKILEFFEKETGILADGVISFTPDVFEKLLALTGQVEMPEYGEVLTAENFRELVQYKTSVDYDRVENEPKKFLADFAPRFLGKLQNLDQERQLQLLDALLAMADQKHILLFSLDEKLERQIETTGLAGELKKTSGDYLAIFHSNVGGGKTDHEIKQIVDKEIAVGEAGGNIVKLRISRTHEGYSEKYFPKNVDFMRVLVPLGSKLISASGFDDFELLPSTRPEALPDPELAFWDSQITHDANTGMYIGYENGYAEFANWLELLPGETKTVELVYRLPFRADQTFTHLLQKQPGSREFDFTLRVSLPGAILRVYPESFAADESSVTFSETINADRVYGVVSQ